MATARDILRGDLGAWLESKRRARESAAALFWPRIRLTLLAVVATFAAVTILPIDTSIAELLLLLVIASGLAWAMSAGQSLKAEIKSRINAAIAEKLSISFDPHPTPGQELKTAYNFGLIPSYSRSHFEDKWFGTYSGQNFAVYEADLFARSENGKSWVTVFSGCILWTNAVRDVMGATVLAPEKVGEQFFGLVSDRDEMTFGSRRLSRIEITDPEFKDIFSLWSTDPVEAHYLIDPARARQIVNLAKKFQADEVRAAYVDGELIITLNWKESRRPDHFETGSLVPDADEKIINDTLSEIYEFFRMIDVMK